MRSKADGYRSQSKQISATLDGPPRAERIIRPQCLRSLTIMNLFRQADLFDAISLSTPFVSRVLWTLVAFALLYIIKRAIQHLVDHPGAMTPLLDPKAQEEMWKADNERPSLDFYVGPTLDTFKDRTMTLGVVDPYAWAESIVDDSLSSSLSGLSQWMNSTQPKVLEVLEKETTWTPEVHALASILDAVRQVSPEKAKIDAELDNPAQFESRCRLWKEAFVDQTAGYTARAKQVEVAMSNSFGFGGTNGSLVFRRI